MSTPAHIARLTVSLLLLVGTGSVTAASTTNALLGATEPVVLELGESSISSQPISIQRRSIQGSATPLVGATPNKVVAQRLNDRENRGFDWSILICLGFGMVGLLWVRRRTTDL